MNRVTKSFLHEIHKPPVRLEGTLLERVCNVLQLEGTKTQCWRSSWTVNNLLSFVGVHKRYLDIPFHHKGNRHWTESLVFVFTNTTVSGRSIVFKQLDGVTFP